MKGLLDAAGRDEACAAGEPDTTNDVVRVVATRTGEARA